MPPRPSMGPITKRPRHSCVPGASSGASGLSADVWATARSQLSTAVEQVVPTGVSAAASRASDRVPPAPLSSRARLGSSGRPVRRQQPVVRGPLAQPLLYDLEPLPYPSLLALGIVRRLGGGSRQDVGD